jgi:hypothetical protein
MMPCPIRCQWTAVRVVIGAILPLLWLVGCARTPQPDPTPPGLAQIAAATLEASDVVTQDGPVTLSLAKNETGSLLVRVEGLPPPPPGRSFQVRLAPPRQADSDAVIPLDGARTYQLLSMPVSLYRAGYVRHAGRDTTVSSLPRALLPVSGEGNVTMLNMLRDPSAPADASRRYGFDQPIDLWIDLPIPAETPPGLFLGQVEVLENDNPVPLATLEVRINLHDFVLPDVRHLVMVAPLPWDDLTRLHPSLFETVTPRLLARTDPTYDATIAQLDAFVGIAHAHRVQVVIPRLQPTVKWPSGQPPQADWAEFDSVVSPWMNGTMFPDRVPLAFWPLPEIDFLSNYPPAARLQYWAAAAAHFDQYDWLTRAPVWLNKTTPGRATAVDRLTLSAEAARVLAANPRVRVTLPLEPDQVEFRSDANPGLIEPTSADRLLPASPALVGETPLQTWPADLPPPQTWLRTDLPGLIPYVGAGGDETDIRTWAWLAFLRGSPLIRFDSALPNQSSPDEAADPNELTWFYPGEWFGVAGPVPTVHLKWLRRAQQDYEYLYLARERGEATNALLMARLLTRPVEIAPTQEPDPSYGLMTGTPDRETWDSALALVARNILLREPGALVDENVRRQLNLETLQWMRPRERPIIVPRMTQWTIGEPVDPGAPNWVYLRLAMDLYNASDLTPDQNQLEFTSIPRGWEVRPQPLTIPTLAQYRVQPFSLPAKVNPLAVFDRTPAPVAVTFTHGFTKQATTAQVLAPLANSFRRTARLSIDGSLADWSDEESIQAGPMVRMLDRPSVQNHALRPSATPASLYSGWSDDQFYLAFKVGGVQRPESGEVLSARNFVSYQFRRAWGEDLVELIVQPVYADNSVGPLLHVVCKTGGNLWAERRVDERMNAEPWQPFESGIRYQGTVDGEATWRGEIALPWRAVTDADKGRPVGLRFNFAQHKRSTGESASWAGPVDHGRDEQLTGFLYLRELDAPGMIGR